MARIPSSPNNPDQPKNSGLPDIGSSREKGSGGLPEIGKQQRRGGLPKQPRKNNTSLPEPEKPVEDTSNDEELFSNLSLSEVEEADLADSKAEEEAEFHTTQVDTSIPVFEEDSPSKKKKSKGFFKKNKVTDADIE